MHTRTGMVLVAALAFYSLLIAPQRRRLKQAALAILAFFFWAAAIDVISRPLLARVIYYRVHDRFLRWWPPMPLVPRYPANVRQLGKTFGDLAAVSANTAAREYREEQFVTDAYGFRNEETRELDAILLGDSFGLGDGTTQPKTWGTLLGSQYGWRVYNLSMVGGPWTGYIDLAIEAGHLRIERGRTVVLWALFTGNDLDDA
ncbi:MAG: hypothetical protein HY238_26300, partial [Acidobacteria bacterium]|nr:hypothetical protein [Acidobacteriota bacterium]